MTDDEGYTPEDPEEWLSPEEIRERLGPQNRYLFSLIEERYRQTARAAVAFKRMGLPLPFHGDESAPVKKKRGRPASTSAKVMKDCAKMKIEGATNREIAKRLYGVEKPTKKQLSSVPTRLRSFLKHESQ